MSRSVIRPTKRPRATLMVKEGFRNSPNPWVVLDDGTVLDRNMRPVCVLGHPEEPLGHQDIANGAMILAAPIVVEFLESIVDSMDAVPPQIVRRLISRSRGRP